ncbi:MAG: DNA recombination protein RmuC [Saprospiraceae bacterium]
MDPVFIALLLGIVVLFGILIFYKKSSDGGPGTGQGVSKDLYSTILAQNEILRTDLGEKEQALRDAHAQLAARDQTVQHLQQRLQEQKGELEQIQVRMKADFENLANKLLDEKSKRFTEQNSHNLQQVLLPLREKIKEFEQNIGQKFLEETREKSSLKKEIEQLREMNMQLSRGAENLVSALKGDSKVQGNWGELQLEVLLEKAGLQKGVHFLTQQSLRADNGDLKRPDFIIHLPDNRQLIVDSKVSLTAFERYHNELDPQRREQYLKSHIDSIRRHVQDLSSKNYQNLYQINSPDYLLLFVPLEPALNIAAQTDSQLFTDALEKNIVLVSGHSLLSTMRTVSHLWKQEKQTRSVLEIARQSGLLYDKFVAFVDDLKSIGTRLDHAQNAYSDAMNKLVHSPKYGDTLVGRAEKIRELGAKASKSLPQELIDESKAPHHPTTSVVGIPPRTETPDKDSEPDSQSDSKS